MKKTLVTNKKTLQKAIEEIPGYEMNPIENLMATNLIANKKKFYIQYPIQTTEKWAINFQERKIRNFVVDFLLPSVPLIIETEGKIHQETERFLYDRMRFNFIMSCGYPYLRFSWDDVIGNSGKISTDQIIKETISSFEKKRKK